MFASYPILALGQLKKTFCGKNIQLHPFARLIVLAAGCVLLTSGWCRGASLEGKVYDPSGRSVARASVSLVRSLSVLEIRETDSEGGYRFEAVSAGTYRLAANAPGLSAVSTEIQLHEGESCNVDLRLELSVVAQQVVVSAAFGGSLVPEVGSSVSVMTEKEIKNRDAQLAFEVLRGMPGVEVNQSGRRGGVTGLFIRGGNSNYNLVMIDGMPLNDFGGSFNFASIPTDGVAAVEVVRGPQSALYGSNAVTGVVNIVSRKGDGPPRFTVVAEGGSFTTRRFAVGGSGLNRGLSWGFNLSRLDSGGVVPNDDFRSQSAFLSLGYRRSPQRQLGFHLFGNANDAGAPGPYGSDPLGFFAGIDTISRNKQNLFGYQGTYAEQVSSRLRQVFTVSVAPNNNYYVSPWGDSYARTRRTVVNTRSEVVVSSEDFLVAGFEYNREQIKNTYITDANYQPFLLPRNFWAGFAENRWNPSRRVVLIGGVRVDNIRTGELPAEAPSPWGPSRPFIPASSLTKVNPRVSAAYVLRDGDRGLGLTRLHGSFGTGIRAATGFELAFTDNPSLRPERSNSLDFGMQQMLYGDRAYLDVTYFYNRFEDQIVSLGGSLTNLSTWRSDNLGNGRAEGAEATLRLRPRRSLDVEGYYTYLQSAILALDGSSMVAEPFAVGQPLLRRPKHSGGFGVTWSHGRLLLNLNGYTRGKVLDTEPNFGAYGGLFTNRGYSLLNTGFAYRIRWGVEVYGRLNNVLNQKYEDSFGYPALHLNFLAGIRVNFPME